MAILVLNAGSSSLKFALFDAEQPDLPRLLHGEYTGLGGAVRLHIADEADTVHCDASPPLADHEAAVGHLLDWLEASHLAPLVAAAGHRVVHGGADHHAPARVDADLLAALHALVPLAPLHLPHNLAAIEALARRRPDLPQVACFDTAFHRTMPEVEQRYALPEAWFARGVRRYGFHGLSYEYIAGELPRHLGAAADGRVVVAHLGHGASLCALRERRSVATTMGFTPLDGIPMATRPGQLDPGVVTWWLREAGLDVAAVDDLLNHHSGLAGLSGTSGDMRALLASDAPAARRAVDYFVHHTARAVASLAGALGGLDALVFTAGIGEHAAEIRARVCRRLAWLGLRLDPTANAAHATRLSAPDSPVSVWRIPTDEARIIARHTRRLLREDPA